MEEEVFSTSVEEEGGEDIYGNFHGSVKAAWVSVFFFFQLRRVAVMKCKQKYGTAELMSWESHLFPPFFFFFDNFIISLSYCSLAPMRPKVVYFYHLITHNSAHLALAILTP